MPDDGDFGDLGCGLKQWIESAWTGVVSNYDHRYLFDEFLQQFEKIRRRPVGADDCQYVAT
jgi:hypothetical protein